jgi:PPOX class probable F420-dependent enzyme
MKADMELVRTVANADHYAVVGTMRQGGGTQASIVSGGVMGHPLDGQTVVAFVARGGTVKLANLRRDPRITAVFRNGPQWVAVEGRADLIGPDDRLPGFDPSGLRRLLRDVFTAAGGTHDNWEEYDRVMAEDRRCCVFVRPERMYTRG